MNNMKKESKKKRQARKDREEIQYSKESISWSYLSNAFSLLYLQGEISTELKDRLDHELLRLYPNTPKHLR